MSMQDTEIIKNFISEEHPDALLADGFDAAIVGTVQQFNKTLVCYGREKCIDILVERDGMSRADAEDFFEFNVVGAYVGENTPVFLSVFMVN